MKKQANRFPEDWSQQRVQRLLDHYEKQTAEEAVAEDEAAWHRPKECAIAIPTALVPQLRKLIARRRAG